MNIHRALQINTAALAAIGAVFLSLGHVSVLIPLLLVTAALAAIAVTDVLKLFQLVPAHRAYFGRKDYQQSLVIERLIVDFHVPTTMRVCPIVRDHDGIALSSRNAYLSGDERRQALALSKALRVAESRFDAGETDAEALLLSIPWRLNHSALSASMRP